MPLDPVSAEDLAAFETLRRSAEEKVGGRRCTTEALDLLSFAEQVAWLVDGLLWTLRTGRMHVWDQHFVHVADDRVASDLAVVRLGAIAGVLAPRFPEVARLVRWTLGQVSPGGPPDWWPDVIHRVWEAHDRLLPAERGLDAFRAVAAARWPEDRDPAACPVPAFTWPALEAADGTPRFPQVTLTVTDQDTPEALLDRAVMAMWSAGASREALRALADEASAGGEGPAPALARHLALAGPDGAPLDPAGFVARFAGPRPGTLGLVNAAGRLPALVLAPVARRAEVEAALADYGCRAVHPDPEAGRTLFEALRAALRWDPGVLLVDADEVGEGDLELLTQAALVGPTVVVLGGGAWVPGVRARVEGGGARVEVLGDA